MPLHALIGIGTALMKTYLAQLRRKCARGAFETSSENEIAVQWYERLGFQLLQRTPSNRPYITSVGHSVDFLLYGMRL